MTTILLLVHLLSFNELIAQIIILALVLGYTDVAFSKYYFQRSHLGDRYYRKVSGE